MKLVIITGPWTKSFWSWVLGHSAPMIPVSQRFRDLRWYVTRLGLVGGFRLTAFSDACELMLNERSGPFHDTSRLATSNSDGLAAFVSLSYWCVTCQLDMFELLVPNETHDGSTWRLVISNTWYSWDPLMKGLLLRGYPLESQTTN